MQYSSSLHLLSIWFHSGLATALLKREIKTWAVWLNTAFQLHV